jgi:hypothetical protein
MHTPINGISISEPLWRRALRIRLQQEHEQKNIGARARLVLFEMIRKTGFYVSLPIIHQWPRALQGEAYLWAYEYLNGRTDISPPWERVSL